VLGQNPAAGVYSRERLVALAGYEVWGGYIAHIGLVTHLRYRGRGYAGQSSANSRKACSHVVWYRDTKGSMHVAHKLGFVRSVVGMAVRLRSPAP
jgi:hypothetical protein